MGGGWSRTQRVHHVVDARLLPRSAAHTRRHFAMQTSTYETRQTRFTAVFFQRRLCFQKAPLLSRRSHLGNIRLYTRPRSPLASPASAYRNRITPTRQPRPIGLTHRHIPASFFFNATQEDESPKRRRRPKRKTPTLNARSTPNPFLSTPFLHVLRHRQTPLRVRHPR